MDPLFKEHKIHFIHMEESSKFSKHSINPGDNIEHKNLFKTESKIQSALKNILLLLLLLLLLLFCCLLEGLCTCRI